MTALFFSKQSYFRKWLAKNYKTEPELIVGYYKVDSGKPSMTWSQSVDEALCFGWIDGIRKTIDTESYCIRFTPRRVNSVWSAVNIKKVEELIHKQLMQPAGLDIFEKRTEYKIYSYENVEIPLSLEFEKMFKANEKAWKYFQSLAPSYRKLSNNWVMTAKQDITKLKRLNELITDSELLTNKWKDNKYAKK